MIRAVQSQGPLNVFISYSHKDEALKDDLEIHLSPMKRQGLINPWQDREIEAGTEWDAEIKKALNDAQIILLLVTPRFMASDYIHNVELTHAIERHSNGTARVIPIIMSPSDLEGSPLKKAPATSKRWEAGV